ncbi:MAG: hypothetical protein KTR18_04140 [Acidiferrobacterales bacterium]|nr:hypothetical protein [Acidiferrobacterales bacterium]
MVFPSPIFLFLFLPVVLAGYFLSASKFRNLVLLVASLFFYAWGEGLYLLVMIYSIAVTWFFGLKIENVTTISSRKKLLWCGVASILAPLLYFKYLAFITNSFSSAVGLPNVVDSLHLPIGISFFTFQALSYLIDVYRTTASAQRSVWNLGLYISLFPQLIAGPIVRYQDIYRQITNRLTSIQLFASGVERFIYGLAKKILIANPLGYVADICFELPPAEIGLTGLWLGVICYSLQIYFDFSGYSDMAIGLGRMFGFKFAENFNYPYAARSIRDFWRRWHISLSTWFRDYVYFPLGGSRAGKFVTIRNLLIVFLLCGFWHGASWNFIIWGLLHGAFLSLERTSFGLVFDRAPRWLQHFYVLLVVGISWVFFRGANINHSIDYLYRLLYFSDGFALHSALSVAMDLQFNTALLIGLLFSTPIFRSFANRSLQFSQAVRGDSYPALSLMRVILLLALLIASVFEIAAGAYNPFIYFRF